MFARLVGFLLLAAPLTAAPKLKPVYPDVVVGREFETPWPPVHIPPPTYHCRIVTVTGDAVDVRVGNVSVGECRLCVDGTRAWAVSLDSDAPLPSRAQVQRLIDQGHR